MDLFDKKFKVLEKGLDAYSKRAELLANNIANVNTPNYKREDVRFESILAKALSENNQEIEGKVTNSKHIPINKIPQINNVKYKFVKEKGTIMRNDGNNVDIEKEQVEQAKNNVRFQFASNRISQNFNIMKNVLKSK